jgi:UDP-N-acetylmuramoylalanine--D-glutamate ligase
MGPGDLAVVEVSSYQLEALGRPPARAAVAVITNLLEDHLERHGDLERYHAAKLRVLELLEPGGRAVLPLAGAPAGPTGQTWSHGGPGADLQVDERGFRLGDQLLAPLAALTLPARFQRANALVALGAAHALGLEPAHLAARLPGLRGPAYRAEELGRFGAGAWRVIDNGVSTTPDSTASVLEDLEGPVALLVGGRSKGQDLGPLVECARGRVARVAAFGAAAAELAEAFSVLSAPVTRHATVEEAVARTFADLGPDELLLFSPACSSFDAYNNFEERVRAFRACLPPAP